MPNLLIPCSGPGTRSVGYAKFHKALARIGECSVLDHIIDSFTDIDKIYITLGYEAEYIREYIQHSNRKNVEFIEIENWNQNQIVSFQQIPKHVFDQPLYYNACDNWSTSVTTVDKNTWYTCKPENSEYYDTSQGEVYSGISFIKDSQTYYDILQSTDISRNDLILLQQLDDLQSKQLVDWYDIGNVQSYNHAKTNYTNSFDVLDKTNQEVYKVNNRIIKLFENKPKLYLQNQSYPHPQPVFDTDRGLSYDYCEGRVNPFNGDFTKLLDNLQLQWQFSINNNHKVREKSLWLDKTWERFNSMCHNHDEFTTSIVLNDNEIDCTRLVEHVDWDLIMNGIKGPCHGDLVLDNIIVDKETIHYIDHRAGIVNDIFYDICKFYHSLYLHNINLQKYNLTQQGNSYTINLSLGPEDHERIEQFKSTEIYQKYSRKIELGIGCIWLSMSPLNVDKKLNKFLFLLAMEQLKKYESI